MRAEWRREHPLLSLLLTWLPAIALIGTVMGLGAGLYYTKNSRALLICFCIAAWMLGLAIHEFCHSIVAYCGGDWTVKEKGYLTFNLALYTSFVNSILIPVALLLLGGIGLPGGAVFIRHDLLRSRLWETAVALAGPFGSFLSAVIFSIPFYTVSQSEILASPERLYFWYALAFSVFAQCTATVLNLAPLPPFDGYGALEPWLPDRVRETVSDPRYSYLLAVLGTLLVFLVFWRVPGASAFMLGMAAKLGPPEWAVAQGLRAFRLIKN
jgi:Zn-dependent protease